MIDYKAMGERVKRFRKRKGWTQAELADEMGISNVTISHIECGTNKPELNTVVNLANALDVTVDMLLCDSLDAASVPYHKDLAELMQSCSVGELRLLAQVIPSLLSAFRTSLSNSSKE